MTKATTVKTRIEAPDGKNAYVVTDKAPPRVAGRRVEAGDQIRLSETEALSEEMAGHILPATDAPSKD
ncbi:Hypothetical protein RG1141_CH24200 [Neorhizobium galegae bv. officinalis bv. officinalis str. HAMBI 1141]|uniref:Uncharacterized protein n=1 Tax=Neorhizobium galegae bv. officinalis bv. officinalis str. HAMBI 1141 TaxID=1028801 RepID=A0A068T8H2_NEOGA|nr:hypothetical protein [Neorhizobium galegae]CDN54758.1 Hypothetical protein RG1141_CH24200 [Neorhizobium galegae bv. officinalis bv. officinalis str. HAMBI 1141]